MEGIPENIMAKATAVVGAEAQRGKITFGEALELSLWLLQEPDGISPSRKEAKRLLYR